MRSNSVSVLVALKSEFESSLYDRIYLWINNQRAKSKAFAYSKSTSNQFNAYNQTFELAHALLAYALSNFQNANVVVEVNVDILTVNG